MRHQLALAPPVVRATPLPAVAVAPGAPGSSGRLAGSGLVAVGPLIQTGGAHHDRPGRYRGPFAIDGANTSSASTAITSTGIPTNTSNECPDNSTITARSLVPPARER